ARGAARFIGCVGDDAAGAGLTAELAGHGVDVRGQRRGRTGTIVVLVDAGGERTMYPDRAGGAQPAGRARLPPVRAPCIDAAAVLHAPSYCSAPEPAASAVTRLVADARQAGVPV